MVATVIKQKQASAQHARAADRSRLETDLIDVTSSLLFWGSAKGDLFISFDGTEAEHVFI